MMGHEEEEDQQIEVPSNEEEQEVRLRNRNYALNDSSDNLFSGINSVIGV